MNNVVDLGSSSDEAPPPVLKIRDLKLSNLDAKGMRLLLKEIIKKGEHYEFDISKDIKILLKNNDVVVAILAVCAVAELARTKSHRMRYTDEASLKPILNLLDAEVVPQNIKLYKHCSRAIGNLCCENNETRKTLIQIDGLPILRALMEEFIAKYNTIPEIADVIIFPFKAIMNFTLGGREMAKLVLDNGFSTVFQGIMTIETNKKAKMNYDMVHTVLCILHVILEHYRAHIFPLGLNKAVLLVLKESTNAVITDLCLEHLHVQVEHEDVRTMIMENGGVHLLCDRIEIWLQRRGYGPVPDAYENGDPEFRPLPLRGEEIQNGEISQNGAPDEDDNSSSSDDDDTPRNNRPAGRHQEPQPSNRAASRNEEPAPSNGAASPRYREASTSTDNASNNSAEASRRIERNRVVLASPSPSNIAADAASANPDRNVPIQDGEVSPSRGVIQDGEVSPSRDVIQDEEVSPGRDGQDRDAAPSQSGQGSNRPRDRDSEEDMSNNEALAVNGNEDEMPSSSRDVPGESDGDDNDPPYQVNEIDDANNEASPAPIREPEPELDLTEAEAEAAPSQSTPSPPSNRRVPPIPASNRAGPSNAQTRPLNGNSNVCNEVRLMNARAARRNLSPASEKRLREKMFEDLCKKKACDLIVMTLLGEAAMRLLFEEGRGAVYVSMMRWLHSSELGIATTAALTIGNFARDDFHCTLMMNNNTYDMMFHYFRKYYYTLQEKTLRPDAHPEYEESGLVKVQHALLSAMRNMSVPLGNKRKIVADGKTIPLLLEAFPTVQDQNVAFKMMATLRMLVDASPELARELVLRESVLRGIARWGRAAEHAGPSGEAPRLLAWSMKHLLNSSLAALCVPVEGCISCLIHMLRCPHSMMHSEGMFGLSVLGLHTVSTRPPPDVQKPIELEQSFLGQLVSGEIGKHLAVLIERNIAGITAEIVKYLDKLLSLTVIKPKVCANYKAAKLQESVRRLVTDRPELSDMVKESLLHSAELIDQYEAD